MSEDPRRVLLTGMVREMREVVRLYLQGCMLTRHSLDAANFPALTSDKLREFHNCSREDATRRATQLDSYAKLVKKMLASFEPWEQAGLLDADDQREMELGLAVWEFLDKYEDTPDRELATADWFTNLLSPGESFMAGVVRFKKQRDGSVEVSLLP
jgi:hypothetical protein